MIITVLNNQSLLDLAVQTAGSAEAAYALAVANGLSISDDLQPGQQLQAVAVINKNIANYYANKGLKPATAIQQAGTPEEFKIFDYIFNYTYE